MIYLRFVLKSFEDTFEHISTLWEKFNSWWQIDIACKIFSVELLFRLLFRFLYTSHAFERRLSAHIVGIFSLVFFFHKCIYIYQRWGDVFRSMEVAATTWWRRAFNLELMNESSHDWTAMSWVISGTSPWRTMHLASLMHFVCFRLAIPSHVSFYRARCLLVFEVFGEF